ncbi:sporulation protein YunB [Desulfitispora alkaliphila]|uniref:sporulation protein YunB n=1 Tax=Desulfitispora alkaliphila TaxID=622674 RepID=UPI003D1BF939
MIRRRRRGRGPGITKVIIPLMLILGLFFLGFLIVENKLKPTISAVATAKAKILATEAINKAIYDSVISEVNYQDLIYIHKNDRNEITMMQANSIEMRKIQSETTLEIQNILKSLSGEGFDIPMGQILGSRLLATYGPGIKVNLVPIGTVAVDVINKFDDSGINQVRHLLYLDIESEVKIVVPLLEESVTVATKIPIAETIIVGPVPDTFVNFDFDSGFKQSINEIFN